MKRNTTINLFSLIYFSATVLYAQFNTPQVYIRNFFAKTNLNKDYKGSALDISSINIQNYNDKMGKVQKLTATPIGKNQPLMWEKASKKMMQSVIFPYADEHIYPIKYKINFLASASTLFSTSTRTITYFRG